MHTNRISTSAILSNSYISLLSDLCTCTNEDGVTNEAICSSSVNNSNWLVRLQSCETVMGWYTAQCKLLLYCSKTIVKEFWTSQSEVEERKNNILAIWWLSSSALSWCFIAPLGMLFVMKTLKDEWYVVIKAYKLPLLRFWDNIFAFAYIVCPHYPYIHSLLTLYMIHTVLQFLMVSKVVVRDSHQVYGRIWYYVAVVSGSVANLVHTHQIKPSSIMHDIQGLHVAHLPVEELGDVDQLKGNRNNHGIAKAMCFILFCSIGENQERPSHHSKPTDCEHLNIPVEYAWIELGTPVVIKEKFSTYSVVCWWRIHSSLEVKPKADKQAKDVHCPNKFHIVIVNFCWIEHFKEICTKKKGDQADQVRKHSIAFV